MRREYFETVLSGRAVHLSRLETALEDLETVRIIVDDFFGAEGARYLRCKNAVGLKRALSRAIDGLQVIAREGE